MARRLLVALNRQKKALNGSRVLLLGLAYKPNTSDARESPAVVVADRLLSFGAEVRAADPHVMLGEIDKRVTRVEATSEEIAGADAVVLLTDHDSFDYDAIVANAAFVLDTRRRLPVASNVEYL